MFQPHSYNLLWKLVYLIFLSSLTISVTAQISPTPSTFVKETILFEEDFENGIPAGWQNIGLDSAKLSAINEGWVIDRDETFTANTGPSSAQSGDFYAYCDGGFPIPRESTASMISPSISLTGVTDPGLIFYLNMHGQAGSFLVNIIDGSDTSQALSPVSADVVGGIHTADEWEEIFIDLNAYVEKSIQLEFVTIKPSSPSTGDISVDNIKAFGISSQVVPTLGQWGIVILILMLLIAGSTVIRKRTVSSLN